MREQEPKLLPMLKSRAEKFTSAFTRVDDASRNLGTSAGPARLNYADISVPNRMERIEKVGEVRKTIATRTIPFLETRKAALDSEIANYALISEAQERFGRITQLVEDGYLSRSDLEAAERES